MSERFLDYKQKNEVGIDFKMIKGIFCANHKFL